jgi:hypothetical protein
MCDWKTRQAGSWTVQLEWVQYAAGLCVSHWSFARPGCEGVVGPDGRPSVDVDLTRVLGPALRLDEE